MFLSADHSTRRSQGDEDLFTGRNESLLLNWVLGTGEVFLLAFLISTPIIQKPGCVWEPNEMHPASVSPEGKHAASPQEGGRCYDKITICVLH